MCKIVGIVGPKLSGCFRNKILKALWIFLLGKGGTQQKPNQLTSLLSADHKGKILHPGSDNDQQQIFREKKYRNKVNME